MYHKKRLDKICHVPAEDIFYLRGIARYTHCMHWVQASRVCWTNPTAPRNAPDG